MSLVRTVVIAYAPLGGAHQSMMHAISEALHELDPATNIVAINPFSASCCSFPLTAVPRLYNMCIANFPELWGSLYHITDGRARYGSVERLAQPFIRPRFRKLLETARPDLIISVLPTVNHTIRSAISESGCHIPLAVVVADLVTIHSAWLYSQAAWYAVPTEEAQQAFVRAGIDPRSVYPFGLPVGRHFCRDHLNKHDIRRRLMLPLDRPVLLIAGGASGAGPIEAAVRALSLTGAYHYSVVMTGWNNRLYRRLTERTTGLPCRVLGYVTNVADWMKASDLLVTRAGPSTIVEAVHCELPMILYGAIPGQETGNVSFVLSRGLGRLATTSEALVSAADQLLADRTLYAAIVAAMRKVQRPDAARQIAEVALSGH